MRTSSTLTSRARPHDHAAFIAHTFGAEPARCEMRTTTTLIAWILVATPATVRQLLGMTQTELADLPRIPVVTWRNREQNRVRLDPAVQALPRILAREPDAVKRALDRIA